MKQYRGTTILSVRRNGKVVIGEMAKSRWATR